MNQYKVVEQFVSINGEGVRAGQLAVFIRFQGCNLNCNYCDTQWANEKEAPFHLLSQEDIYRYIKETGVYNVTLTGGEPLKQPQIARLLQYLSKDEALRIEIETNGSVSIREFQRIGKNIAFTLDYKLPGSGMEASMCLDNYQWLQETDTVKFVVSDEKDLEKARQIITDYELTKKCHVYFSPVFGRIKPDTMVEYMKQYKLNDVNLQLQMHKVIWNPDMRGV